MHVSRRWTSVLLDVVGNRRYKPKVHESLLQRDLGFNCKRQPRCLRRAVDLDTHGPTDLCPGCTADRVGSCGVPRIEDCTRRIVKCVNQNPGLQKLRCGR